MYRFIFLCSFVLLLFSNSVHAQMWNGQDTLYGNEWINFDQDYFKIPVGSDGIYRLDYSTLLNAGIPVNSINQEHFQLFHLGVEVPIYISASGATIGNGDFIEFFGQKNRSEIDRFLFEFPEEEMLNPYYSLFSDTVHYFLTWNVNGSGLRYTTLETELSNLPPSDSWYWHKETLILKERQVQRTYSEGIAESTFEKGEGFATNFLTTINKELPVSAPYSNATDSAYVEINMVSSNGFSHDLEIKINDQIEVEDNFSGYQFKKYIIKKPASTLENPLQIQITGGTANNDRYALASAILHYPRNFDFANAGYFPFEIRGNGGDKYLEINNFNNGSETVLYDFTNNIRHVANINGNSFRVKFPAVDGITSLAAQNTDSGWQAATIKPVDFINYVEADADYIIVSNRKLYDDGNGNNLVQQYADYRASQDGGNHSVIIAEIGQLYDQFAYGIRNHPISIRNFAHYAKKNWTGPRYMLLIGKARQYNDIRTPQQIDAPENQSYFVPTFGIPGSDNLLLASTASQVPVLAIGRIPATSPQDIRFYLDKIRTHEAGLLSGDDRDRSWRKEIIHLGGGGSPSEQLTLRNHLEQMADIIEQGEFGGNVFSFYKTSSEPVQQSQSEELTSRINSGASIITFFGHSGTGGFDFSIDDPTTYENSGKYPVMFSLGCLSGQIHLDFQSVGEKFIFQEEKAALGFVATTGFGYISALSSTAKKIYDLMGSSHYGKGIGEIMQETLLHFDDTPGIPTRTLVQQITLNGDPALVVAPGNGPDYKFNVADVKFSPQVIDAQRDSFELSFAIQNIGRALQDSFWIEITRQFPDESQVLLRKEKMEAPGYELPMTYTFPVLGTAAIGNNRFFIKLDTEDEIQEYPIPYGEENNELTNTLQEPGVELYIFANQVSTVYPPKFGITGNSPVSLKGITADPFASSSSYLFQMDTTALFNSPFLKEHNVSAKGGVLSWTPEVTFVDSTVYYWRIGADTSEGFGIIWDESSFLFLQDQGEGWNQSHYFQHLNNYFNNMEIREDSRRLEYLEDVKFVRIQNGIFPSLWPSINFNNTPYGYIAWNESTNGGVYIAVIDSTTADPWLNNPPGLYGSRLDNSWAYGWGVFPFSTQTEAQREKVINFLRDTVPSGNYVAIYTIQHENINYEPEEWAADSLNLGTNLFQLMEEQGASLIRSTATTGPLPYVFVYKKDDDSFPVIESIGNLTEPLEVVFDIPGLWDNGSVRSQKIGPASSWETLARRESETEALDETKLEVYGIKEDTSKDLLIEDLIQADTTLNWIPAQVYPYLELKFATTDTLHRTSPQLDYWRIFFKGLPDAVMSSNKEFTFHRDTLQQGEPLNLGFTIENVTPYPMDSVLVSFKITDVQNDIILKYKRFSPLPGNGEIVGNFSLDTRTLSGKQNMIIQVNPDEDQPESNLTNNIGFLDFYVEKDQRNPILDVTFDSERILDGDLVSAKPHIVISLLDENQFLALSDTTQLRILIKKPGAVDVIPIHFSSAMLQFYPAEESQLQQQNKAVVEFDPVFMQKMVFMN